MENSLTHSERILKRISDSVSGGDRGENAKEVNGKEYILKHIISYFISKIEPTESLLVAYVIV